MEFEGVQDKIASARMNTHNVKPEAKLQRRLADLERRVVELEKQAAKKTRPKKTEE